MSRVRPGLVLLLSALSLAAAPQPAWSHHTFTVKYDPAKTVRVSGTISSVDFVNPHIHFTVAAEKATWTVESESVSVARTNGLTESVLKAGAKVTVSGWPARDGSSAMGLNVISVSGGPTVTMRRTAR